MTTNAKTNTKPHAHVGDCKVCRSSIRSYEEAYFCSVSSARMLLKYSVVRPAAGTNAIWACSSDCFRKLRGMGAQKRCKMCRTTIDPVLRCDGSRRHKPMSPAEYRRAQYCSSHCGNLAVNAKEASKADKIPLEKRAAIEAALLSGVSYADIRRQFGEGWRAVHAIHEEMSLEDRAARRVRQNRTWKSRCSLGSSYPDAASMDPDAKGDRIDVASDHDTRALGWVQWGKGDGRRKTHCAICGRHVPDGVSRHLETRMTGPECEPEIWMYCRVCWFDLQDLRARTRSFEVASMMASSLDDRHGGCGFHRRRSTTHGSIRLSES